MKKSETILIRPGVNYSVEIAAGIYKLKPEDMSNPNINQMIDWANVAQKVLKISAEISLEFLVKRCGINNGENL